MKRFILISSDGWVTATNDLEAVAYGETHGLVVLDLEEEIAHSDREIPFDELESPIGLTDPEISEEIRINPEDLFYESRPTIVWDLQTAGPRPILED